MMRIAAEVSRDEATMRRLVDDRFAFNSSAGKTTNKEEPIQSVLLLRMQRSRPFRNGHRKNDSGVRSA